MAGINLIQRLEARAALAEKLISLLKTEIAEVSSMISAVQDSKRIELLKAESESLEEKVLKSKEELIQIQKRNGVEQVPLPNDKIGPAAAEKKTVKTKEKKNIKSSEDSDEKDKKEKKEIDFGRLDLRVGRILEINDHPDGENLYIEKIDLGENEPRQIISGLRKHIFKEDLILRPVICICNLKPAKIRGQKSYGMLMCALYNNTVEPLWPPVNAVPGEILVAGSYVSRPDKELNPKEKVFETVVKDLKVNENKVLMLKDVPVEVKNRGPVITKILFNCTVG
ncbi:aminoacyl tRNA synthase complex-interacting multifunctional protein 1-like isoform X2 [Lycorma delicatula]|uniref:aminoacyl tRNA synthase complex-interacting multifunctional protein 1-like isoform X2 n=1 Tax=Lycorma delicatula TaxID=130591 RepID=UPI003F513D44